MRTRIKALTHPIEACINTPMILFKRNQVEEAISRTLRDPNSNPTSETLSRIKRLIDTDRALTNKARDEEDECTNYAFSSVESPGKGVDLTFSQFEAFALQTALRVMDHGWPQGFAVNSLRTLRKIFEAQHKRILGLDKASLFDLSSMDPRPGDIALDNTDPHFLVVLTSKLNAEDGDGNLATSTFCRGMPEVAKKVKEQKADSWTLFELATYAHRFAETLAKTQPRSRGRS